MLNIPSFNEVYQALAVKEMNPVSKVAPAYQKLLEKIRHSTSKAENPG